MILGSVSTTNPFGTPHLFWCEAAFATSDALSIAQDIQGLGPFSITLPPDLHGAVAKRRSEFLAGRFCAAAALRQAGLAENVGRNGRAPVWPAGVCGAITHSKTCAIAAISPHYQSVGLDCEMLVPQDRAMQLCATILSEDEARFCPPGLGFGTFFTLVFSAKEALYKALSPRLTRVPPFLDARLCEIVPGQMQLAFENQTYAVQFRLSGQDCITLVVA